MSIETILVKRRALHKGEFGLFPSTPMSEEDLALIKLDDEVVCQFYSPRQLQQLKFLWALAQKVAENSDNYRDKDEAMEDLKLRAGYTRILYDHKTKKLELRPRSLKRISSEQMRQLLARVLDYVCNEILPGIKRSDLRREIEEMLGDKQGL